VPEVGQFTYSLRELTALMIKDRGIRTGHWMIWTRFNFGVSNIMSEGGGPSGPGVVSMLIEAGIQKAEGPNPLAVDAAEVWKSERKPRLRSKSSN
jgi:hypothetical protein